MRLRSSIWPPPWQKFGHRPGGDKSATARSTLVDEANIHEHRPELGCALMTARRVWQIFMKRRRPLIAVIAL
jgi:hypothetical protein